MEPIITHPLARKLAIAVIIKLLVLLALWWVFFSDSAHHELTPEQVGSAILQPANPSKP